MKKFAAELLVPSKRLAIINRYLNATAGEYQGEDNTIIETASFPNGYEMDIKCCGARDSCSWAEAVLFRPANGGGFQECACSDVAEEFLGEWELPICEGLIASVLVKDGGDIEDSIVNQVIRTTHGKELAIPHEELEKINAALQSSQAKGDTIIYTVPFPDGRFMDIRCCFGEDGKAWSEAILFEPNGAVNQDLLVTDAMSSFTGVWEMRHGETKYHVHVVDGGTISCAQDKFAFVNRTLLLDDDEPSWSMKEENTK